MKPSHLQQAGYRDLPLSDKAAGEGGEPEVKMDVIGRREFLAGSLAGMLLPRYGRASQPASGGVIRLRNAEGAKILNAAIGDPSYWAGADIDRYKGQLYDESRLKPMETSYLTMITGEGQEDFKAEEVVHTVLTHQHNLQTHMEGCTISHHLDRGVEPDFGVPYKDLYILGDFTFFYGGYFQRLYRYDLPDGRTACAFENLKEAQVTKSKWSEYMEIKKGLDAKADVRWPIFNDIVPIEDIFGVYLVEPGKVHTTRVTLISKIRFGSEAGWIAQVGSEMPFVLKDGLRNGFDASVSIARSVKSGQYPLP